MKASQDVHKSEPRTARGVRMERDLWTFVDDLAEIMTDGNASALIAKWVREKRDAVREAA